MDLADLVEQIRGIHDRLALHAIRAVNVALTARNWLIGGHIHEYELTGQDVVDTANASLISLPSV
jgi:hypothetical protein